MSSSDVFEIVDFTTSSEWERFVAELEEAIVRWPPEVRPREVKRVSGLRFGRTRFQLSFFNCKLEAEEEGLLEVDLMTRDDHQLIQCFGLKEFAVLAPETEQLKTEDRLRLVLSACALAASHVKSALPVLCASGDPNRGLYFGQSLPSESWRLVLSSLRFIRPLKPFKYLNTWSRVFRERTRGRRGEGSEEEVVVSARFTYKSGNSKGGVYLESEWLRLAEEVVIDSEHHSDFDAQRAHAWCLVMDSGSGGNCRDGDLVVKWKRFLRFRESQETGSHETTDSEDDFRHVMNRLSDEESREKKRNAREVVRRVLDSRPEVSQPEVDWKSAPRGSPVYCLAEELLECETNEEARALWSEFVRQLRVRWEERKRMWGVEGSPDFRFCLLHQKLQLMNKCMEKEDKEEFFDCDEEVVTEEESGPEGRLRATELCLLGRPEVTLFAPVTQDPAPLTEDQLEEQSRVLQQMSSEDAREQHVMRARVQSASLVSDMEAFRAANPWAEFEDFVRWHSPRDFREGGEGLSARFKAEDNLWRLVWRESRPLAVQRQRPLFDVTREAEKVLHQLQQVESLAEVTSQWIRRDLILNLLRDEMRERVEREGFEFEEWTGSGMTDEVIGEELRKWENLLSDFRSLRELFSPQEDNSSVKDLLRELCLRRRVSLNPFSSEARALQHVFRKPEDNTWCEPVLKEFVLRTKARLPEEYSRDLPQRMSISVSDEELRVHLSACEDIQYF